MSKQVANKKAVTTGESKAEASKKPLTRPAHRPPVYDRNEVMEIINVRITEGESLRTICKSKGMPHISVVMDWLRIDAELAEQYARSREIQADYYAESIIEIADDATNDYMEKLDANGTVIGYSFNGENVQRSRLRIDARKWFASKMNPKKYSDKVVVTESPQEGSTKTESVTYSAEYWVEYQNHITEKLGLKTRT